MAVPFLINTSFHCVVDGNQCPNTSRTRECIPPLTCSQSCLQPVHISPEIREHSHCLHVRLGSQRRCPQEEEPIHPGWRISRLPGEGGIERFEHMSGSLRPPGVWWTFSWEEERASFPVSFRGFAYPAGRNECLLTFEQ